MIFLLYSYKLFLPTVAGAIDGNADAASISAPTTTGAEAVTNKNFCSSSLSIFYSLLFSLSLTQILNI